MKYTIPIFCILLQISFVSCSTNKKNDLKIKLIGQVDARYTIDSYNKPNENKRNFKKLFPWSDTSKINSIKNTLSHNIDSFEMNDTSIVRSVYNYINDEEICCILDTLKYYVENIDQSKFLFLTYGTSVLIYKIENAADINNRARKEIVIPTWNTKINEILDEIFFKDSSSTTRNYLTNEVIFKSYYSIYLKNRDLKITTLRFPKRNDRIISQISKDMSQQEVDSFTDYVKNKYPEIKYKEEIIGGMKLISMTYDGFYLYLQENTKTDGSKYDAFEPEKYTLHYSDFYTLTKVLLNRTGEEFEVVPSYR